MLRITANWPLDFRDGSRADEPPSLAAVTARDSSPLSNGPGSEILSGWRVVQADVDRLRSLTSWLLAYG